ncbi:hypothetical protein [Paraburkholderia sp.]|uniref:hypothetical protein n=1 Tax=Paraburkholderia sp. TaxID=1926495 RepID=UPI003D6F2F0E
MTHINIVSAFQAIERHPGYDKVDNPQRFSVLDLTPVGITWQSGGATETVRSSSGIKGLCLSDLSGVAVVEAPYESAINRAYIVNADGSRRATISPQTAFGRVVFYDVLYLDNGALAFLAAAPSRDARIEVNETDGSVIHITESR